MKDVFSRFFRSESSSGWLLLACIGGSLAVANSPLAKAFSGLLATETGYSGSRFDLRLPLLAWINDGLMAVFFLLVGLEVKRAFLTGELATFRKASLPVFAALGGCAVPALIFGLINAGSATARGWAIPMATDIAFALAVLNIAAGKRAGFMKSFLSTLAIADDLCAILVIAVFYSGGLHTGYLLASVAVFGLQLLINKAGIKALWCYLFLGSILWYFIHHSGIHATIAGVLTAMAIPLRGEAGSSPLERLEHLLLKPVNFVIMPLFALANTAIPFSDEMLSGFTSPLSMGIVAGLLVGKPVGVMLLSFTAVKLKAGELPDGMDWKHVLGISLLAGIGFTMAIFVVLLSLDERAMQVQAKATVLLASGLMGLCGYLFVRRAVKR